MLRKTTQRGQALILLIIALIVVGSIMLAGGINSDASDPQTTPTPTATQTTYTIITPPATTDRNNNNLQIGSVSFGSVTPTAGPISTTPVAFCGADDNVCHPPAEGHACCPDFTVHCSKGKCLEALGNGINECGDEAKSDITNALPSLFDIACGQICGSNDGYTCYGKPVIYLYPTTKTNVDVTVHTSGDIFVSDPHYPNEGWRNVEAYPNGDLVYQDKDYKELFYESKVKFNFKPKNGIIIPISNINEKLGDYVDRLGLTNSEKQEFLDYWVPKLKDLNSPYILFSVVDKTTKELNDHVEISPKPDTMIEFIAYFKPLDTPIAIDKFEFPLRPERKGFTAVEWGGTIDK